MQWLSPMNFTAQQQDIISRKQEGTGQWFLDSAEFKRWLDGFDKTLSCPGMPGAGKTVMAAITIDHLDHLYTTVRCHDVGIAYLFCNYKAQADQSALSLISNILKQLVQARPDMTAPTTNLYERHSERNSRPSLKETFEVLQSICSKYTTVYIVVDALDELAKGPGNQLIDMLSELQTKFDVRLMVTSRFIHDILQQFQSSNKLEVRASDEDVRRFVAGQMRRLPKYDEQLKHHIEDKIAEAVEGM